MRFRHRVTALTVDGGRVDRRRGRGAGAQRRASAATPTSRDVAGDFSFTGAGGDRDLRRHRRQPRPGAPELARRARRRPPRSCSPACPTHVDGLMLGVAERAGGRIINLDRMWHYPEGVRNHAPVWTAARHPDPVRADARCGWMPSAGDCRHRCSPVSTRSARCGTSCAPAGPLLVPARPADRRPGVRPVRLGAEPRPHRKIVTAAAAARAGGKTAAGAGVPGQGRRFPRRARPSPNSSRR